MSPDGNPEQPAGAATQAAATVRLTCTICNQKGLHARAAARFVKTAGQFDADVQVRKNGAAVSGRGVSMQKPLASWHWPMTRPLTVSV